MFRVLLSGPPSAIISPSSHQLCLPPPSFVTLHLRRVSSPRHCLHRPGISANHCRRCRPLVRVCVCMSSVTTSILVEPLAFSPLPRYLSSCTTRPPDAIISPSPQHLCLPLIRATSAICYPYNPNHPLPLNLTPLYFYLSISSHSLSLSSISNSLSVSLYFSSTS